MPHIDHVARLLGGQARYALESIGQIARLELLAEVARPCDAVLKTDLLECTAVALGKHGMAALDIAPGLLLYALRIAIAETPPKVFHAGHSRSGKAEHL